MFIKIPFEKVIEFKTNISEITKMSLEHDYNVNDNLVLGNFYISGEYRAHEVSINTDDFNYTLPFEVNLREDINKDTIEFNIEDFSYDIEEKNLKVNIVYSLKAEVIEKKEEFKEVDERELESELAYIDEFLDKETNTSDDDKKQEEEIKEEVKEEVKEEIREEEKDDVVVEEPIRKIINEEPKDEERLGMEEEKSVMETIKDSDDTFVTYHIHIVKENETLESICQEYNVSNSLISEYNNLDNVVMGDKILIPKIDE